MIYALTWLPEVLERAGLKVAETVDWRTRGRAEMGEVKGVMCHHTGNPRGGNMPTLDVLIHGRSDLRGPLSQLGLGRDGTFYVIAAGRANHAGLGRWEEITTGNSSFIGIEAEHSGQRSDPWPEAQLDAYRRGVAAILAYVGASSNMCCAHREYALPAGRKDDPTFDMGSFRSEVSELLLGKSPSPPIPLLDAKRRPTLRRGNRGGEVELLQRILGVTDDGTFGPETEARLRAWQRAHALVPDGIAGPATWSAIDAEPAPELLTTLAAHTVEIPSDAQNPWADQIDISLLQIAFRENTASDLDLWIEPLKAACRKFGIDTQREVCSFLANIAVESRGLTQLTENLNYKVDSLLRTFNRHRISEADARRLGRRPGEGPLSLERQEEIANLVYGGQFGKDVLGNSEPGDGWKFRGFGPKQLTGRDNCTRFGEAVGVKVDDVPDYLRTREGGCLGAGWYWKSHGLDKFAATDGLRDDRAAINPALLGLDVVERRFTALMSELDRRSGS